MDNEKLFELMEKMYADLKGSQEKMYSDIAGRFEALHIEMRQSFLKLENELNETKKTLYDGYAQNTESIKRIEMKLDEIR
ncbi:hypothetical protein SAMN05443428_11652 [Caloramator quimbayensis]|uniref:Uncharacterized protein n=1 Tax=Caloramator quimbayensis TaxID=1147123 RepID=A0A1T4XYW7_9CLOT|nr:hypothetical protein [Caloramator quimbayensis]SKA94740.1 hypothetical protein SAMN05443428_11652 [Caloramator quimbayensis]